MLHVRIPCSEHTRAPGRCGIIRKGRQLLFRTQSIPSGVLPNLGRWYRTLGTLETCICSQKVGSLSSLYLFGLASRSRNNKLAKHKDSLALKIPSSLYLSLWDCPAGPRPQAAEAGFLRPQLVTSATLDAGGRCSPTFCQRWLEALLGLPESRKILGFLCT